MRTSQSRFLLLLLVLGVPPRTQGQTPRHEALPYPTENTPSATDRGALTAMAGDTPIAVTIALKLPKLDDAEKLQQALYTRGNPLYHQFLTADQFVARFAPSNADIAKVVASLAKYGLRVERTTATTIKVTGLPANIERAFAVSLHAFEVAPQGDVAGYTFHAKLYS